MGTQVVQLLVASLSRKNVKHVCAYAQTTLILF